MAEIITPKQQLEQLESIDDLKLSMIKHEISYKEFMECQSNLHTLNILTSVAEIASDMLDGYTNVLHKTNRAPDFFTIATTDDEEHIMLEDAYDADGKRIMSLNSDNLVYLVTGLTSDDVIEILGEENNDVLEGQLYMYAARNFFTKFFPND